MIRTEMRNPRTTHIDRMTTEEMVSLIAKENYAVVKAVEEQTTAIAAAVDAVSNSFSNGGRLFFIGAGTSGRLGVLDAAECPPTFGVERDMVTGIIAGGIDCMVRASENEEDNAEMGKSDLLNAGVKRGDTVVGISAAGGAAYVASALKAAKEIGATVIALTCNRDSLIASVSDIAIVTDTGEEVVTGSTRMKAGTAHKMVLNMITTCSMIKQGKVYENMMINLKPTNIKLKQRMINIVCEICDCDAVKAENLLRENDFDIRRAANAYKG